MKKILLLMAMSLASNFAPAEASQHEPAAAQAALADGEVRKVDKAAQKITLKHGEIKRLDMPPMTMVFRVKDPAMLDQVKAGDKVRFSAEQIDGAMTITVLEPAR